MISRLGTGYGLYLSWLVSCIAVLGSLYVSQILGFEPCHLCWYQRICLFPLVIQLGIACWRGTLDVLIYVLPQTIIGFCLATYQLIIQAFPQFSTKLCTDKNCSEAIDIGFGPYSMPLLSLIAFLLIFLLLLPYWRSLTEKK